MLKTLAMAVFGLAAAGCASIQSTFSDQPAGQARQTHTGLAYMAPMRHLTVTATRAQGADETAAKAATAARGAYIEAVSQAAPLASAQETLDGEAKEARAVFDAAQKANATDALPGLLKAAQLAEARAAVATARSDAAKADVATKKTAYERALDVVAATPGDWRETIDIALGPAVGDRRARFAARLQDSAFRSIAGSFSAPNGLLQSSNVALTGAGEPVLIGLAQSLVSFAGPGGARAGVRIKTTDYAPRTNAIGAGFEADCSPTGALKKPIVGTPNAETYTRAFDPTDPLQVQEVNVALCRQGFSYRVRPAIGDEVDPAAPSLWPTITKAASASPPNGVCTEDCNGLVYRQNEPLMINIVKVDVKCAKIGDDCPGFADQPGFVARSFAVNIPNRSPLYVMPYGSAAFVTRTDDAGFDAGTLVSLKYDHPSEAAVIAGIPFRVLNAATSALSEIVQLRVNLTGKQTELTAAQQALEDAEAAPGQAEVQQLENAKRVLKLQQEIATLQAELLKAQAGQPAND